MAQPPLQRLEELFNRAVDLAPTERGAFLDHECWGAPELRPAVEALLRRDGEDVTEDGRLASPVAGAAGGFRHDAPTLPAAAAVDAKRGRPAMPAVPGY